MANKILGKQVTGLDTVMKNLNKEIMQIKGASLKGLIRAQILIRRDMDLSSPIIPLKWGNLRASYYTVTPIGVVAGSFPAFTKENAGRLRSGHQSALGKATTVVNSAAAKGPLIVMGFSAFYAWYVHEMIGGGSAINWSRPGSGPKFFEAAIKKNSDKIIEIVRQEAYVD
jgi:hypothetical protein